MIQWACPISCSCYAL